MVRLATSFNMTAFVLTTVFILAQFKLKQPTTHCTVCETKARSCMFPSGCIEVGRGLYR